MTSQDAIEIVEVPLSKREVLDQILDESFEGWYLRHSKKILREVETVRAAKESDIPVGLIMLKRLEPGVGYIYYVAVAKANRRKGVGGILLRDALGTFERAGLTEAFASVEKENIPSEKLFASEGFSKTNLAEVSSEHGTLRSLNMYRMMMVVPGEILLRRTVGKP